MHPYHRNFGHFQCITPVQKSSPITWNSKSCFVRRAAKYFSILLSHSDIFFGIFFERTCTSNERFAVRILEIEVQKSPWWSGGSARVWTCVCVCLTQRQSVFWVNFCKLSGNILAAISNKGLERWTSSSVDSARTEAYHQRSENSTFPRYTNKRTLCEWKDDNFKPKYR